jgi:putative endonuclease
VATPGSAGPRRSLANRARGEYGERRARAWYESRGFVVLDANWRDGRGGELDLVVARGGLLVFCEVKARASAAYGSPAEAVTPTKQARIRRLAAAWLRAHGRRADTVRFDVAAVTGSAIDVVEGAF